MSYSDLFSAYRDRHASEFSKKKIQDDVNKIWRELKSDKQAFPDNVNERVSELRVKTTAKKASLLHFFTQTPKVKLTNSSPEPSIESRADNLNKCDGVMLESPQPSTSAENVELEDHGEESDDDFVSRVEGNQRGGGTVPLAISSDEEVDVDESSHEQGRIYNAPAQETLRKEIAVLESRLNSAVLARDSGIGGVKAQKEFESIKRNLENKRKSLAQKEKKAKRQKIYREDRRKALLVISKETPELAQALHVRDTPGRPRLETDQPELLKTITELAIIGGGADIRRRTEQIRTCRSLDDLHRELVNAEYQISRSSTYLRLLPRDPTTREGKRHAVTVPVKLCKAQADFRKAHQDGKFCTAFIRSLEVLIGLLGPEQVFYLSQDDKARVPIGITAANKQAPLLMHLEYRIRLPDHDWVVAAQHKLIPSVYGAMVIRDNFGDPNSVSYSGPTYVAIRSGKHDSSNASTHSFDFDHLLTLESFKDVAMVQEEVKPVVVISSDGGPDENPRYPKVISHAIHHFKQYNLDALFLITNAPGRSAFNRIERRMAPLSKETSGVILPHNHYGSHLNPSAKTIDKDLEIRNFEFAGQTLAEIWSQMIIDNYSVVAEYVIPGSEAEEPPAVSSDWYASHVRESQYLLQIVKCSDRTCCTQLRSNLKDILSNSNGFLPPPYPLRRKEGGEIQLPLPKDTTPADSFPSLLIRQTVNIKPLPSSTLCSFKAVPYDLYCPSVMRQLSGRVCKDCGLYFATKGKQEAHTKDLHKKQVQKRSVRPKRVLTKRRGEALCVLEEPDALNGQDEAAWVAEDDLDCSNVEGSQDDVFAIAEDDQMQIITDLRDWVANPWTENEDYSEEK